MTQHPKFSETELHIPISGKKKSKRSLKSALSPRVRKDPLFDASTLEAEADEFCFTNSNKKSNKTLLSERSPSLLAIRNKATSERPKTSLVSSRREKKQEIEIYTPRGVTSILTKRPQTTMTSRDTHIIPEAITREIESEKKALDFTEEPIAYFSKRKDGRGHRFIYLNHRYDKSDPRYNPYDLVKVPFAEVNSEYFTMSANGVTHMCGKGETEYIPIDQWTQDLSIFMAVRKLKIFSNFSFWKPFRIWKNFVMKQRYDALANAVMTHPIFYNAGFFETQLNIRNAFIIKGAGASINEIVLKYLLSFIPQSKFILKDFDSKTAENVKQLSNLYSEFIIKIQNELLNLDSKIRDPKLLQVKDTDFPEMKRRNPNLSQLMILEKKKAEKRVRLTEKVNTEILALGHFIRNIDYMLMEDLAEAVRKSWLQSKNNVVQDQSSVFQVEVSYNENGHPILTPPLEILVNSVKNALESSLHIVSTLPRILTSIPLRAHLRESHENYKKLFSEGPRLVQMIQKDSLTKDVEKAIVDFITESYNQASLACQPYNDYYPVFELGKNWNPMTYVKTRDGNEVTSPLNELKTDDDDETFADIDFNKEPIVNIKQIKADISKFIEDDQKLQQFHPYAVRGALFIDSKQLRSILDPIPMNSLNSLKLTLQDLLSGKVDRIRRAISAYSKKLKIEPITLEQFIAFCELINKTADMTPKILTEIEFINELYHLLEELVAADQTESLQNPLPAQMQIFISAQDTALSIKNAKLAKNIQLLQEIAEKLDSKLQKYFNLASVQPNSIAECEPNHLMNNIEILEQKVFKLTESINICKHYQDILEHSFCSFSRYNDNLKELEFDKQLYKAVQNWKMLESSYMRIPFENVDMNKYSESLKELLESVTDLQHKQRMPTSIVSELVVKVNNVAPFLPQLNLLSSSKMQSRHWQSLFEECNFSGQYRPDIRLDELISLGILNETAKIEKATSIALGESHLQEEFEAFSQKWQNVQLPIVRDQIKAEDSLLIENVDPLLRNIEDGMVTLSKMASLEYAHGVRDQVLKLQSQLEQASLIVSSWNLFQSNWIILQSLFQHEETKTTLSQQASKFTWVRRRWVSIIRHTTKDLSLLVVCTYPSLLDSIKEMNSTLESIMSSLSSFVNAKRASIPRLFVLGSDDILSLTAYTDFKVMKSAISRLFMRITGVDVTDDGLSQRIHLHGLLSSYGLALPFQKSILFAGGLDRWLPQLIASMHESMSSIINSTYSKMAQSNSASYSGNSSNNSHMMDWLDGVSPHISMVLLYLQFSQELEECFRLFSTNIHSFQNYANNLKEKLQEVIGILETPLTTAEYFKNSLIVEILSYQMNIVQHVSSSQNYKWWWNMFPKLIYDNGKLLIESSNNYMDFGYEFWGDVPRIVITPLLTKCLINISYADLNQIPMLIGTPGSGRRSVIEHMAALEGRFLLEVPAFPNFSPLSISQMLLGIMSTSSWITFSDVDQLPFEFQSKLYEYTHLLRDAQLAKLATVEIDGISVPCSQIARIFFTSSHKPYSNTVEQNCLLPQIKASVKPIALSAPEKRIIIETKFSSFGLKAVKIIASKFDACLTSIVQTFSENLHSNSVFPHLFSVLEKIENLIRDSRDPTFTETFQSETILEDIVICRGIYMYFYPILGFESQTPILDCLYNTFNMYGEYKLFCSEITDPPCFTSTSILNVLSKTLKSCVKEEPTDYLIKEAINLFSVLQSKRTVILSGPPNSGKSSIIEILERGISNIVDNEHDVFPDLKKISIARIYFKSDQWNQIFGTNVSTEQGKEYSWNYGIISAILNRLEKNNDNLKVLVFDGPLTPKIQQFISEISSLNDSYQLSMNIINFRKDFRFIVETNGLNEISPSLIPHCAFIHLDNLRGGKSQGLDGKTFIFPFSRALDEDIELKFKSLCTEILPLFIKYVSEAPNYLFSTSLSRSAEDGKIILMDHLTQCVSDILFRDVQNLDVLIQDKNHLTQIICSVAFRVFSTILLPTQIRAFESWAHVTFHLTFPNDWSELTDPSEIENIDEHFKSVFPRPSISHFEFYKNEWHLIPFPQKLQRNEVESKDNVNNKTDKKTLFLDAFNVLVPESIIFQYHLDLYLRIHASILLFGDNGKTTSLKKFFEQNDKYTPVFVYAGSSSTPSSITNFLLTHSTITKKFSSKTHSSILIFEDLDPSNTHVVEYIRSLISTGYITSTSSNDPKFFEKIKINADSYIITTSTNQFDHIPSRLLNHFFPLQLVPISETSRNLILSTIYQNYSIEPKFAQKLVNFFNYCIVQIDNFPKNIKSLLQLSESICHMSERMIRQPDDEINLLRVLIYEIYVFYGHYDPSVMSSLRTALREIFSTVEPLTEFIDPKVLFYTEFKRETEDRLIISGKTGHLRQLQNELQFYLQVYNSSAVEKIIIQFNDQVMKEWSILHRALAYPGCSVVLHGMNGTGRFTLLRLVAHMCQYDFVNISSIHYEATKAELEHINSILRDIVSNCVLMNKKSCLFIRYSGKMSIELKIILDFMHTYDFTPFFNQNLLDNIYMKFAIGQQLNPSQRLHIFHQMQTLIRANFHLAIAYDIGSDVIQSTFDNYFKYLNCVHMEFIPITPEDRLAIANNAISTNPLQAAFGTNAPQIPHMISNFHDIALSIEPKIHFNQFYDLLDTMSHFVTNDYAELMKNTTFLSTGCKFLSALQEELDEAIKNLAEISPTLQRLTLDCEALQSSYTSKKEAIDSRRKKIQNDLEEKQQIVKNIQNDIKLSEEGLNSLKPRLLQAQNTIEGLKPDDIATIRLGANNPEDALRLMLEVLCIFLDIPISYERGGQKLLMDPNFVLILIGRIRYEQVTPKLVKQIQPYYDDPNFSQQPMDDVGPALGSIFNWITLICKYIQAKDDQDKLKDELSKAENDLHETIEESKAEEQSIKNVESSLINEEEMYKNILVEKNQTEDEVNEIIKNKDNIELILKNTAKLQEKWTSESENIQSRRESLIGDDLLFSFYLSYCGMMNKQQRMKAMDLIASEIRGSGYSMSQVEPLNCVYDRFVLGALNETGGIFETNNIHSVLYDIYHIKSSMRAPLVIDPDGFVEYYFTKAKKTKESLIASLSASNLDQIICSAVAEGKTLILFDVDYCHPFLFSLLSMFRIQLTENISKEIRIGSKVATYDKNFRVILFTNLRKIDDIPPELLARTTVIDTSDSSKEAATNIISTTLVEFFTPGSLPQISSSFRSIIETRPRLKRNELELLATITDVVNSDSSILSDENLLNSLIQAKENLFLSINEIQDYSLLQAKANSLLVPFRPIVRHIMMWWDAISRYLPSLFSNNYYSFPFGQFNSVIVSAFQTSSIKSLNIVQNVPATSYEADLPTRLTNQTDFSISSEQLSVLLTAFSNQILQYFLPSISYQDSFVLLFIFSFLKNVSNNTAKLSDLDVILAHLKNEVRSSCDFTETIFKSETISSPLEHLKFTNIHHAFLYINQLIIQTFGNDYPSILPVFQIDSIISQNPSIPTLIFAEGDHNPSSLIDSYIQLRTRGDNFFSYFLYNDDEQLKYVKASVIKGMTRGIRVLIHYQKYSPSIFSFLNDLYNSVSSATVHTNFRLIILCDTNMKIPHRLLAFSRRIFFSRGPSIRQNMLELFAHHGNAVRSSTNPKAIKKISYAAALILSLLHFRDQLNGIGFSSKVDISETEFRRFIEFSHATIDASSVDLEMKNLRDLAQDIVFGSAYLESSDRRKIRAIVHSLLNVSILQDGFTYFSDSPQSDKFIFPPDVFLSNFSTYIEKIPVFTSLDPLLISPSAGTPFRDWTLSTWITNSLLKIDFKSNILGKSIISEENQKTLIDKIESYLISLPDVIPYIKESSYDRKIKPTLILLENEIEIFNHFIHMVKCKLTEEIIDPEVIEFVGGQIPSNWKEIIRFDISNSSQRLLSYLCTKREFLNNWIRDGLPQKIDLSLIYNIRGFFESFLLEISEQNSIPLHEAFFDFSFGTSSNPSQIKKNSISITNLTLVGGHWDISNNTLDGVHAKPVEEFPDITLTLTRNDHSSKCYMCPLLRTIILPDGRKNSNSFSDGQSDNLIWYVPLKTETETSTLIANGTSLVCIKPDSIQI